jgi:hypothetical protein
MLKEFCFAATSNNEKASRQTHTQGNKKKKHEGKQHRNKTQMENMQSVTTRKKGRKKQRSRILQA